MAMTSTIALSPAFDARYADSLYSGTWAAVEPMTRTLPRPAGIMWRSASRHRYTHADRFVASVVSQPLAVMRVIGS